MYRNIIKPVLDFLTVLIAFIVLSPIFVNAFINAKAKVGKHCVINTKANIEHNVQFGDFCHISTCATVNGDTVVGKGTFIGSNATISKGITIAEKNIINAGDFIKR